MALQTLSEIHEALRRCAERENWSRLAPLMARRDELLSALPPASRRAALAESLKCNRFLLERAKAARRQSACRLQELKRGRGRIARYASNQAVPTEE